MSEYLSKKAVLEFIKSRKAKFAGSYKDIEYGAYLELETIETHIESGAFDAPDGEIQRLKVALDWVKRRFEEEWTYELGTGEVVEEIIVKFEEALSGAQEKEEPNHDAG